MRQGRQANNRRRGKESAGGQLRIIGGAWRGRKLPVANLEGLRPTGDRLRETLFNWLMADVTGARCLDLFAGTGALGFEALSRGAAHCDFVEIQARAQAQLRANLETLQCETRAQLWSGNALDLAHRLPGPYDLVFLDPPFAERLHDAALEALRNHGLLAPDACVYVEYPREQAPDFGPHLTCYRQKETGSVACALLRQSRGDGPGSRL